jgi:hypothetical protein
VLLSPRHRFDSHPSSHRFAPFHTYHIINLMTPYHDNAIHHRATCCRFILLVHTLLDKPRGYDQPQLRHRLFPAMVLTAFWVRYTVLALIQPHLVLYILSLSVLFGVVSSWLRFYPKGHKIVRISPIYLSRSDFVSFAFLSDQKNRRANGPTASWLSFVSVLRLNEGGIVLSHYQIGRCGSVGSIL